MFKIKGGINASNQSNIKTTYTFIGGKKKYIFKNKLEYSQAQINQMYDDEYYSPIICAYISNVSDNVLTLHVLYKSDNDAYSTGVSTKNINLTLPSGYAINADEVNTGTFYHSYLDSQFPSNHHFYYQCRGNKMIVMFRAADNTLTFPSDITSASNYSYSNINCADTCWYIDDITKSSSATVLFDKNNEQKGVLNTHEGILDIEMQTYGVKIKAVHISDYYIGIPPPSMGGISGITQPQINFTTSISYYFVPYGSSRNATTHSYTPQGGTYRIPGGYASLYCGEDSAAGEKIDHVELKLYKDTISGEVLSGSYNIPINNKGKGFDSKAFIRGNKITVHNGDSVFKTDGKHLTKYNILTGEYEFINYNLFKNTDQNNTERDPYMLWQVGTGSANVIIFNNDNDFSIKLLSVNPCRQNYFRMNANGGIDIAYAGYNAYSNYLTSFYNNNTHGREFYSDIPTNSYRWSTGFKQYTDVGSSPSRPDSITGSYLISNIRTDNKNLILWELYEDGIACFTNRLASSYIDKTAPYKLS